MKRYNNIVVIILITLSLFLINSCKKKEIPTLTTTEITNITSTSASGGGIVTDEGSRTVTARGICWSTGIYPTIEDNKTTNGIGLGSFTSNISGLNGATTYYIRAYATNSAGTAYGNEVNFATNSTFAGQVFYNNNGKIINAVCYGYFLNGQAPGSIITENQIMVDLIIIKNHWDAIRLYTSDDNTEMILKVISDNNIDLKVLLGIWISGNATSENASQVARAIALTNTYINIVQAISCGNEISDIYVSNKDEIAGYLKKIHNETSVPVTIDDVAFVWLDPKYDDLARLQDFLAIHIYGQWSNIPLENTVSFINDVFNELKTRFPQKQILITETGWTTSKNDGQFSSVADEDSQKQFYTQCQQWSTSNNVSIFYFEAFNERWKGATATEAETNWGFYYADRNPKLVFQAGK